MTFALFIISLAASIIGAICGIGGGVIIKPVLDAFGWMSVSSASFLSGCTVLSMTTYAVIRAKHHKDIEFNTRQLIPISVGATAGGILGKTLFQWITSGFSNSIVGLVQAVCLIILLSGTIAYTCLEHRVLTHHIQGIFSRVIIGMLLGALSAFLGIGGGPFNLVALSFFFTLQGKEAAVSSLFIILVAQTSSLFMQIVTGTIPDFSWTSLIVMICGGIIGSMLGRKGCEYMDEKTGKTLFLGLNLLIICICCWNIARFIL